MLVCLRFLRRTECCMIGQTISHYKILEKLGGGGMGVVYKAEDLRLKRLVALKFLPAELTSQPDAKARFMHEAQAASALEHSNICTIHEINETDDGRLFICMAYYDGETLKKQIEKGPMAIDRVVNIAVQICRGLQKAHEKEIIHRDIKPANIMVTTDDEVRIVDFGLAKLSDQTALTKEGSTLGTVAYMSPEQARGEKIDHRTDIWSLGVVMYEMISGRVPFKGEYDQAVLYEIASEQPQPLTALRSDVPLELEHIVSKCLAKRPEERYQHLDDLLVDLRRLKKDSDPSRTINTTSEKADRPVSKKIKISRLAAVAASILVIAAAAFAVKSFLFDTAAAIEPKPIVVITFKNQTGDAAYDYLEQAIPNLLITSLEQSKYLKVITWERMYDLLEKLGKKDVREIDEELGFEICRMEGVESIVLGSFVKAGDIFATDVKVLDVQSKLLLKSASAKGEGVGSILQRQIDDLSEQISGVILPTAETQTGSRLSISDITTPSMEAYHYFLKGRDAYNKMYYPDAEKYLEKAIALDSTFAIAYLYQARTHAALAEDEAADALYEKAKMYAGRAGEKDRMYIESAYAERIENNPEKRVRILKEIIDKFPQEKEARAYLGWYYAGRKQYDLAIKTYKNVLEMDPEYGFVLNLMAYTYCDMREFDKAADYFEKYLKVLPGDANPYDSIADFYLSMGEFEKAIDYYQHAIEIKPDFGAEWRIACIYGLNEKYDRAIEWIDRDLNTSELQGSRGRAYLWKGIYLYLTGQRAAAQKNIAESIRIGEKMSSGTILHMDQYVKAWLYLDQGKTEESLGSYKAFYNHRLRTSPQYLANHKADYFYFMGLRAIARANADSARFYLREIENLIPELTPIGRERMQYCRDYLYSRILVAEDSLDEAYKMHVNTTHFERPFRFTFNYFSKIFPFQKDELALLAAKEGRSELAVRLYGELINFELRSENWGFPNPLYHYRLGKIYEEMGAHNKAIEQYTNFLNIWKDADPELKPLLDARKRLSALTTS